MKKLILFLCLFISVGAMAQQDTVYIPGSIPIEPIVVNAVGDTAFSMSWVAFNLSSDTTQGCNTYVQLYNKKGLSVANFNQAIPASVVKIWGTDNKVIDDYILFVNPRLKRYVLIN